MVTTGDVCVHGGAVDVYKERLIIGFCGMEGAVARISQEKHGAFML